MQNCTAWGRRRSLWNVSFAEMMCRMEQRSVQHVVLLLNQRICPLRRTRGRGIRMQKEQHLRRREILDISMARQIREWTDRIITTSRDIISKDTTSRGIINKDMVSRANQLMELRTWSFLFWLRCFVVCRLVSRELCMQAELIRCRDLGIMLGRRLPQKKRDYLPLSVQLLVWLEVSSMECLSLKLQVRKFHPL